VSSLQKLNGLEDCEIFVVKIMTAYKFSKKWPILIQIAVTFRSKDGSYMCDQVGNGHLPRQTMLFRGIATNTFTENWSGTGRA
jgi:hypothetical protein